MSRRISVQKIREKFARGEVSLGSWMQIPHGSVAEIMGAAGYDWVAVDLEHGSISVAQLPDLFRALELGGTLPLARISESTSKDCKQALDAGAAGVIVPNIQNAQQLVQVRDCCRWPPGGARGVGFSRVNLFGKDFDTYKEEAQAPFLVAMIEHYRSISELEAILSVEGLDAILIGPYDLSASMGLTGRFDHPNFCAMMERVRTLASAKAIPAGVHVVQPDPSQLEKRLAEGYRFIAYSMDAVFLRSAASMEQGM
jgi:2-dehydro-3-deoxyglucarate aldolase